MPGHEALSHVHAGGQPFEHADLTGTSRLYFVTPLESRGDVDTKMPRQFHGMIPCRIRVDPLYRNVGFWQEVESVLLMAPGSDLRAGCVAQRVERSEPLSRENM